MIIPIIPIIKTTKTTTAIIIVFEVKIGLEVSNFELLPIVDIEDVKDKIEVDAVGELDGEEFWNVVGSCSVVVFGVEVVGDAVSEAVVVEDVDDGVFVGVEFWFVVAVVEVEVDVLVVVDVVDVVDVDFEVVVVGVVDVVFEVVVVGVVVDVVVGVVVVVVGEVVVVGVVVGARKLAYNDGVPPYPAL